MTLKTRLQALERVTRPEEEYHPWQYLTQDMNHPELYTTPDGRQYRQGAADWPPKVILIAYHDTPLPAREL